MTSEVEGLVAAVERLTAEVENALSGWVDCIRVDDLRTVLAALCAQTEDAPCPKCGSSVDEACDATFDVCPRHVTTPRNTTMSEKLSEEQIAELEEFISVVGLRQNALVRQEGRTLRLNTLRSLLNAARAEARPAPVVDREAVEGVIEAAADAFIFSRLIYGRDGDEEALLAKQRELGDIIQRARATLTPATSPGEGSSGAESAARIASDHAASETLRKSEKPVNTEPTGQWCHYSSMPKDGRWFYARTAEGQERLVHYADKYDRLPICDQGVVWSTFPIEWCEAAPTPDDAGGGG